MKEKNIQKAIRRAVISAFPGCIVYKIHGGPYQEAGIPDLVCCIHGYFIAIEVKTPGGRYGATERQALQINRINDSGGYAFVSSNAKDAVRSIQVWLRRGLEI